MIRSFDPRTGEAFGPEFAATSEHEIEEIIAGAHRAFPLWSGTSPAKRAISLRAIADALDANAETLVEVADRETGLGKARLTGEVGRTTFQLRTFAQALESGDFVKPVLDAAVDAPLPVGHPRFLRTVIGIGPVVVFGASNFPFAFSVMGGDTASALAAGCPVVIKAHSAHPQTSQKVFDIALEALLNSGAPAGIIGLGHGHDFGKVVIADPRISAGAFTGSKSGGRALFDMAQSRTNPIPFYGELGSINPVIATTSGMTDPAAFATAYLDSLLLGNGQFCTNPSLLFVPNNKEFLDAMAVNLSAREAQPFLSKATKDLHDRNRDLLVSLTSGRVQNAKPAPETGLYTSAQVHIFAAQEISSIEAIHREYFGPTGIVITYESLGEAIAILDQLEGALAASIFSGESEPQLKEIIISLSRIAGRVCWNAWPTGVAVTTGQHHGGPYPATTSPLHTSVGVFAINRFLRPITLQGFSDELVSSLNVEGGSK
ncbi:MAG: aldehyde dehydrogenase family protein [Actinobacteria bacterium]|nr:aldehyde dehydrogenase family protein [Actinomycetota bacterium]